MPTSSTLEAAYANDLDPADLERATLRFHQMLAMGRLQEAYRWFRVELDVRTQYGLKASQLRIPLLESFFPADAVEPRLDKLPDRMYCVEQLGLARQRTGQPGRALEYHEAHLRGAAASGDRRGLAHALLHRSRALAAIGRLREAEASALEALPRFRQLLDHPQVAESLRWIGTLRNLRGAGHLARPALLRAMEMAQAGPPRPLGIEQAAVWTFVAHCALGVGDANQAFRLASQAWEVGSAVVENRPLDPFGALSTVIAAARIRGLALIQLGLPDSGGVWLRTAAEMAAALESIDEVITCRLAEARVELGMGNLDGARRLLEECLPAIERGPYRLHLADAHNLASAIAAKAGDEAASAVVAGRGLRAAWCDGRPFAYRAGVIEAETRLKELGLAAPAMDPYDPTRYPPMPEVEILAADS